MSCYAAGYTGYAKIGGLTLPFISGDIAQSVELVTVPNIGTRTTRYFKNFMKGKRIYQGNLSFVLFKSYTTAIRKLLSYATSYCSFNSDEGGLEFSPSGNTTYKIPGTGGSAVVSNMFLRSTAGNPIEGSVVINSTNWDEISAGSGNLVFETVGLTDDNNFIPWYDVSLTLSNFTDSNLVNNYAESWSFSLTNEVFPLFTLCNTGNVTTGLSSSTQDKIQSRTAKAMRYGMMNITGEIKYWSPTGNFNDPTDGATLTIDFGSFNIILNNLVFTNDNTPNTGANMPVLKTVQFQALAGCEGAPITIG